MSDSTHPDATLVGFSIAIRKEGQPERNFELSLDISPRPGAPRAAALIDTALASMRERLMRELFP